MNDLNVSSNTPMNELAIRVASLWLHELSDEYVLYLNTSYISGLPNGVVLGGRFTLTPDSIPCYAQFDEVLNRIRNEENGYVNKIALFNNEVFYYLIISEERGKTAEVEFCMSSMILGRSQMKVLTAYYTANDRWLLEADSWYRELDGFCGTMQECIAKIDQVLNEKDFPYDSMKLGYYDIYEERINRPLEVEVSAEGIRVNDWFGI